MLKAHVAKLVQSGVMAFVAILTTTGCGGEGDPYAGPRTTATTENGKISSQCPGQDEDPDPGACGYPETEAPNPIIYNGATTGKACNTSISCPYKGGWFRYDDKTSASKPMRLEGSKGGCAGASDCAIHATGAGFTDYGAGLGFDLMDLLPNQPSDYDASAYEGLQFYAKGTLTATRTTNYAAQDNTIHVKFNTATDRLDDDFGYYCSIGTDWTVCTIPFSELVRDGFKTEIPVDTDSFDKDKLRKIQFEFSRDSTSSNPLEFDVWIDNISFY